RQCFRALGKKDIGHLCPERRALSVTFIFRDTPGWLCKILTKHTDPGRCRWCITEPHVNPLSIWSTPLRANLTHVFTRTFSQEPVPIYRCLDGHLLCVGTIRLLRIAHNGVDL